MQARQLKALQRLTQAADDAARYTSREGYMNGPLVSQLGHTFDDGTVQVSIHNATGDADSHWFHTSIHVLAHVTPGGKVTVRLCDGLPRGCIDAKYLGQRVRRIMRKQRSTK